ncbi:type VII secretion target [Mycolicibacterium setense]|uniref:type VII secretion target n=1 Tax=Mycolicibacterium setense TaxID=431269 RepID=UPI0006914D61|nr:type VII secretion target [Mycolicibacterium setense]MCV7109888.1 ESX-1 secretion-associated protein [Mycolicibacterium setense]
MSDGTLGVTASHVRELSRRQRTAQGYIKVGATITDGVTDSMVVNHGSICTTSIVALAFANDARAAACEAMAAVSQDMSEKLNISASHYAQTDVQGGADIGKQMHPR